MADDNVVPEDSAVPEDTEIPEDSEIPENSELDEDSVSPEESDALVSRLRVIEEQPLDQRADAYVQLYEELRHALEGADNAGFK